jgi:hypothetical protein
MIAWFGLDDRSRSPNQNMPSRRIVTRLPLDRLWDDDRDIVAQRERYLSRLLLREMLRQHPVEFYVADIGSPLRRIDVGQCYEFWKSEAYANLVDEPDAGFCLEDFPGQFVYVSSEWSGEIQTPIVLLEKHH